MIFFQPKGTLKDGSSQKSRLLSEKSEIGSRGTTPNTVLKFPIMESKLSASTQTETPDKEHKETQAETLPDETEVAPRAVVEVAKECRGTQV